MIQYDAFEFQSCVKFVNSIDSGDSIFLCKYCTQRFNSSQVNEAGSTISNWMMEMLTLMLLKHFKQRCGLRSWENFISPPVRDLYLNEPSVYMYSRFEVTILFYPFSKTGQPQVLYLSRFYFTSAWNELKSRSRSIDSGENSLFQKRMFLVLWNVQIINSQERFRSEIDNHRRDIWSYVVQCSA